MNIQIQDIFNYHPISENLATSGQPDELQLAAIAEAGYAVIINLALHDDPRYSLSDEPGLAAALGLTYVHIPVLFDAPQPSDLKAFFHAMEQHRSARIWLHCAANKRVSVFYGLYRHLVLGHDLEQAFALQRRIWEPDQVWTDFIASALGRDGAWLREGG